MEKLFWAVLLAVIPFIASCILLHPAASVNPQAAQERDLIAASQAGALPVFFNPDEATVPLITPGNFIDSQECLVRDGLPNFFQKAVAGGRITIGYIGGSITRGKGMYRNQSAKFIHHLFPSTQMKAINAGVAGTGTDLGACRIREQLLTYHPDLIFIEFAVNGAFRPGMEGMVRQIWNFDPHIDICFLYTIHGNQWQTYAAGVVPDNIQGLEAIADYYHIPSVHMGLAPSIMAQNGRLSWKASAPADTGELAFSKDGVHPLKAGGNLYAQAIARAMIKMKKADPPLRASIHQLPAPLLVNNWEDAKMLDPRTTATFSPGWQVVDPLKKDSLRTFAPWFPYIMQSGIPGASFTFRFKGTMVGLFDIGGPEAGQLRLIVDGQEKKRINRFNRYCDDRYRGQCTFVRLSPGLHSVTFEISEAKVDKARILGAGRSDDIIRHPKRYQQTVEWLGKILIRGTLMPAATP